MLKSILNRALLIGIVILTFIDAIKRTFDDKNYPHI